MRVILASSSTRRRDWISNQDWINGHQIEFRSMDIEESRYSIEGDVPKTVRRIANAKAIHAGRNLGIKPKDWVALVSDTLIEDPTSGIALGKPLDAAEAEDMLRGLSGRRHFVHSCTALITPSRVVAWQLFSDTSEVYMRPLTDSDLQELIKTGSWRGKAGGYDIKGLAARHIEISDGDEITVLGFSSKAVNRLREVLSADMCASGESDSPVL
ncbi:MAG: Maf family protein [Candidatus Thermoplasmatota archaeon]|nr:Maf family protein [Candidatus Thermoplasmatota archaeon]